MPPERPNRLLVAGDLPAERRITEERLVEQDLDVLGGIVEVGADLLDDDVALLVDVLVAEQRPDDQLARTSTARSASRPGSRVQ